MELLNLIPASIFETIGIIAGLTACFTVAAQVRKEFLSKMPSSLSWVFLIGWVFIYSFWFLYGMRFGALAIWLTNGIAVILQISLFIVVIRKRKTALA